MAIRIHVGGSGRIVNFIAERGKERERGRIRIFAPGSCVARQKDRGRKRKKNGKKTQKLSRVFILLLNIAACGKLSFFPPFFYYVGSLIWRVSHFAAYIRELACKSRVILDFARVNYTRVGETRSNGRTQFRTPTTLLHSFTFCWRKKSSRSRSFSRPEYVAGLLTGSFFHQSNGLEILKFSS